MATLSVSELSRFVPLANLSPLKLKDIAEHTAVLKANEGNVILSNDCMDKAMYFLLDGSVKLLRPGQPEKTIKSHSIASSIPIGATARGEFTVEAIESSSYIHIDKSQIEHPDQTFDELTGLEVNEVYAGDESVESQLMYTIFEDYVEGKLEIPHLPDISQKVRSLADNPDSGVKDVVRVILRDPGLVTRLLRVANSAMYKGNEPVESVTDAVVRLGLGTTKDLVTSFSMQNLFKTDKAILKKKIIKLWHDSALVGTVCYVIAEISENVKPEKALLAGLLHKIGGVAVLKHADEYEELMKDEKLLDNVVNKIHPQVGELIMGKWNLTDELASVVSESNAWSRDSGDEIDVCDLVIITQLYLGQYSNSDSISDTPILDDNIPAFVKLKKQLKLAEKDGPFLKDYYKTIKKIHRSLIA